MSPRPDQGRIEEDDDRWGAFSRAVRCQACLRWRGSRWRRHCRPRRRQPLIGIDVAQRRSTPLLHVDSDEYSVSSCRFKNED